MELREYLSIRRAYNLVRRHTDSKHRLTFEEFAILCMLERLGEPIKTSEIANYQGALRPTMTHRTNHLAALDLIERVEGSVDRRNIECRISEKGREFVRELSKLTENNIASGQPLGRTSSTRLRRYIDAMGSIYCTAGELILLCLLINEDNKNTITSLVEQLGFLQPTISMSVGAMEEKGLIVRLRNGETLNRSHNIQLTDKGKSVALAIAERVYGIVVRRQPRA